MAVLLLSMLFLRVWIDERLSVRKVILSPELGLRELAAEVIAHNSAW